MGLPEFATQTASRSALLFCSARYGLTHTHTRTHARTHTHTHTHTHRPRYIYICSNRPHLLALVSSAEMRPNYNGDLT